MDSFFLSAKRWIGPASIDEHARAKGAVRCGGRSIVESPAAPAPVPSSSPEPPTLRAARCACPEAGWRAGLQPPSSSGSCVAPRRAVRPRPRANSARFAKPAMSHDLLPSLISFEFPVSFAFSFGMPRAGTVQPRPMRCCSRPSDCRRGGYAVATHWLRLAGAGLPASAAWSTGVRGARRRMGVRTRTWTGFVSRVRDFVGIR